MSPAPLELWVATANPKKARELYRLLPEEAEIHLLSECPEAEGFEVVEDAPDFAGNAAKKARETAAFLARHQVEGDALVVADDSGLAVDALGGRPGVHSARYAGPGASDAERIGKLLEELVGVPDRDRSARFVCALVAVFVSGLPFFSTEETCEGKILEAPEGSGGFGYDPVFAPLPPPRGDEPVSFACLTPAEKDAVSHRGKALRKLARRVREHLARNRS